MIKNRIPRWLTRISVISFLLLFTAACLPVNNDSGDSFPPNSFLESTVSFLGSETYQLATQVKEQEQIDDSQQNAISVISTWVSSSSDSGTKTPTPLPLLDDPTPYPVCTPPACAPEEMYHCPEECPGGCGTTCATATPGISSGIGQVWGKICYPGDTIPKMTIYFQEVRTGLILSFTLEKDHDTYKLVIPAGVYVGYAWLPDKEAGGSYSQYVRCGGNPKCTDHNLVPFLVQEGHVTTAVDICDWSGDMKNFPDIKDEQ